MTLSRRANSSSRPRAFSSNWLDPSSAWALDEYAVIPPIASEPYDWTLEDEPAPSPQLIPIPPPVLDGSARARQTKRKANLSEGAVLIPIEKVAPGQLVRKTDQLVRRNRIKLRRKHLISSVALLLLSVIALFVFAYLAQKYGR